MAGEQEGAGRQVDHGREDDGGGKKWDIDLDQLTAELQKKAQEKGIPGPAGRQPEDLDHQRNDEHELKREGYDMSKSGSEGSAQGDIDLGQLAAEIRKKHGKGTDVELDQGHQREEERGDELGAGQQKGDDLDLGDLANELEHYAEQKRDNLPGTGLDEEAAPGKDRDNDAGDERTSGRQYTRGGPDPFDRGGGFGMGF